MLNLPSNGRRRFISIAAVAGVAAALTPTLAVQRQAPAIWQGFAMGAETSIKLYHSSRREAEAVLRDCVAEINRYEDMFSLYRQNSLICRLNRDGRLENAPDEFLDIIAKSTAFSRQTDGAFDISMQPLWELYAGNAGRPSESALAEAVARVGYRSIKADGRTVFFAKSAMAITLNGIAQGYITDRITELLKKNGIDNVLVNIGEMRAAGSHPDGSSWQVAIEKSGGRVERLINRAMATSAAAATEISGGITHILDPRTGLPAHNYASLSVIAPDATTADALSTGFSVMPHDKMQHLAAQMPDVKVILCGQYRV